MNEGEKFKMDELQENLKDLIDMYSSNNVLDHSYFWKHIFACHIKNKFDCDSFLRAKKEIKTMIKLIILSKHMPESESTSKKMHYTRLVDDSHCHYRIAGSIFESLKEKKGKRTLMNAINKHSFAVYERVRRYAFNDHSGHSKGTNLAFSC